MTTNQQLADSHRRKRHEAQKHTTRLLALPCLVGALGAYAIISRPVVFGLLVPTGIVEIRMVFVRIVVTLLLFASVSGDVGEELKTKLTNALTACDGLLSSLDSRWQTSEYPNFFKSVAMSHTAWEVMKLKFQAKILGAATGDADSLTFVVGFMGSSVTAGHDSPFNLSFPILTGSLLAPVFAPLGITVKTRNAAMGNNPCVVYDICTRTFAGPDADVVHWEQSFNCFGSDESKRPVFEQFIRQSLSMPRHPIVVFSDSSTPNWDNKDCDKDEYKNKKDKLSDEDVKLVEMSSKKEHLKIVSEMNKDQIKLSWSAMLELFKSYQVMAGVQLWDHHHYESYRCHGPYIREWQNKGVASWHPSILGHQLRAAHYAYFWTLILKDAITEVMAMTGSATEMLAGVKKHIDKEHRHVPSTSMYPSFWVDNMQCLTTFEPKNDPEADLKNIWLRNANVAIASVEGTTTGAAKLSKEAFKENIFEELTQPHIIKMAKERGYLDFKHMLHGNKDSAPLSLQITVRQIGTLFLCQPPGNWGKLPDGFKNFWETPNETRVYITEDVAVAVARSNGNATLSSDFVFVEEKARKLKYTNRNPKDTQTVCVDFEGEKIKIGTHVLTIVAADEKRIMISTVLVP